MIRALAIPCLVTMTIWWVGCSTLGLGTSENQPIEISYPDELKNVPPLISAKKFQDARLKIDDYLDRSQNIHWFGHAYFLKGFLYELENSLPKSAEFYKTAIEHASGYDAKVEAKALYNLSYVYEKMGNREGLIVTLLDLMKRRRFFAPLTGEVEIPARLAAAYGAEGKLREAKIFHREASENFESMIRKNSFRSEREELSKALFYLGLAVYELKQESFSDLLFLVDRGQKYFLASAESAKSLWASRAKDRLLQRYDQLWSLIQNFHATDYSDPAAEKKNRQEKQLIMASDFYDLVLKLQAEEFPLGDVNRNSKAIVDESRRWARKIEQYVQSLNLGPDMIRNKKIENKPLHRFIEKKPTPVKVGGESSAASKDSATLPAKMPTKNRSDSDIGSDPNL